MQQHRFIREGNEWFIDLPEFLAQGGSKADLQMVSGADTMLDIIAGNDADVNIKMDTESYEGPDKQTITENEKPRSNNFLKAPMN